MLGVNPNPVIFIVSRWAMERYCREEGIPVRPLPDLVPYDEDVLAGVRSLLRAVRRLSASRMRVGRQAHATPQRAAGR